MENQRISTGGLRVPSALDDSSPIARSAAPGYTEVMDAVQRLQDNGIKVDAEQLTAIAQAYSVAEISIFGSSVRDDITDDSDIDLLVTFTPESTISLFDLIDLEQQLAQLFGRPVDIVEPASLKNPVRRHEILSTKQPLYAA